MTFRKSVTVLLSNLALAACSSGRMLPRSHLGPSTSRPPAQNHALPLAEPVVLHDATALFAGIPLGISRSELQDLGLPCRLAEDRPPFVYFECGPISQDAYFVWVELYEDRITVITHLHSLGGLNGRAQACDYHARAVFANSRALGTPDDLVEGYCDPTPREYSAERCARWRVGNGSLLLRATINHHDSSTAYATASLVLDEPGMPRRCDPQAPLVDQPASLPSDCD